MPDRRRPVAVRCLRCDVATVGPRGRPAMPACRMAELVGAATCRSSLPARRHMANSGDERCCGVRHAFASGAAGPARSSADQLSRHSVRIGVPSASRPYGRRNDVMVTHLRCRGLSRSLLVRRQANWADHAQHGPMEGGVWYRHTLGVDARSTSMRSQGADPSCHAAALIVISDPPFTHGPSDEDA